VIEVGVTVVANGEGGLFIVDVQLGIASTLTLLRMQSTHFVVKGTVYPEGVRTSTVQDGVVHLNSNGREGERRVILANAISEFSSARSGAGKELV
jgi:hypothetical protein